MARVKNLLYLIFVCGIGVVCYVIFIAGIIGECYSETVNCSSKNEFMQIVEIVMFLFWMCVPVLAFMLLKRFTPSLSAKTLGGYLAVLAYLLTGFFGWECYILALPIAIFLWRTAPSFSLL